MVALSALGSGCVAAQNVEFTCMRQAQLQNMLKKYLFVIQYSRFLDQQIAQPPLF